MADPKRKRGRPRDPGAARAIGSATLELLGEQGYAGLTMAGVAERSGVAKTTIYRRWPTKADMVLEALAQDMDFKLEEPTGQAFVDLKTLIADFYERMQGSGELPLSPIDLLREADVRDGFYESFIAPVRTQAIGLVERARAEGELREEVDPEELVDTLMALAIYRPLVMGLIPDRALAMRVFDAVMVNRRPLALGGQR